MSLKPLFVEHAKKLWDLGHNDPTTEQLSEALGVEVSDENRMNALLALGKLAAAYQQMGT